ncbi:ABC transporter permease subunit [Acidisoma cellulosilytica]|uniref:ABC transporter permease subunit n=1 Tax=Acidisoma cellulosilyticum TaxID=2802395 RepID=A0A964E6Q1_9PROT|nr:ABC transporter permease subunit [Acidisoma cellulosilyticum]MCB8883697.1 ABC transporter permease subunit [Acidisoma cellulosilyticum]
MTGLALLPRAFAGLVVLFLISPLVLCVLFSFSTGLSSAFPIPGLGLHWYKVISADPQFWQAVSTTTRITLGCGIAATLIGLMAALGLARLRPRWAVFGLMLLCLPLMLPPLVLGLSLLTFFTFIGLHPGVPATILAHLVFTQPFVTAVLYARVVALDQAAVEAARDLGASPLRAFLHVTLPAIGTSIVGSLLIAMALSLDDFVIAFFTTRSNTLSTLIWGMMRTTITPAINAVGTGIILITLLITALALLITRYRG